MNTHLIDEAWIYKTIVCTYEADASYARDIHIINHCEQDHYRENHKPFSQAYPFSVYIYYNITINIFLQLFSEWYGCFY